MYIAQSFKRRADGSKRPFFFLRETYWDPKEKRERTRYLAYVGVKPVLTLAKAKKIAKRLNVSLEELRKVRGLKILDDQSEGG